MRRIISLANKGVQQLEDIKIDLQKNGKSVRCPSWASYSLNEDSSKLSCAICKQLFPRVQLSKKYISGKCPCHTYKPSYLIHRLSEIINYNERKKST